MIIRAATTIFFALTAGNVKLPKALLDAMDIMKLARGLCESKRNGSSSKQYHMQPRWGITILWLLGAVKLLAYFLMVKTQLGLLITKWDIASSRLNTKHVRSLSLFLTSFSFWSKMLLFSTALLLALKKVASAQMCICP